MNLLWLSMKAQFRVPISIFFSLIFPILMMLIIVFSNENFPIGKGYHFIDKYFLISMGIGLVPIALISFPMWIGESMEKKVYQRLHFFHVNTEKIIWCELISYFLLAICSIFLNIITGYILFGLKLPNFSYLFCFTIQILYGIFSLMLVGSLIGITVKNTKILLPVGMIFLFTTYMFCGVFLPYDEMPEIIQNIGAYIPLKYVINDFFDIWTARTYIDSRFLLLNTTYVSLAIFILLIKEIRRRRENK